MNNSDYSNVLKNMTYMWWTNGLSHVYDNIPILAKALTYKLDEEASPPSWPTLQNLLF